MLHLRSEAPNLCSAVVGVGFDPQQKGLRCRISPTCTLSQNGYGDHSAVLRTCRRCVGPSARGYLMCGQNCKIHNPTGQCQRKKGMAPAKAGVGETKKPKMLESIFLPPPPSLAPPPCGGHRFRLQRDPFAPCCWTLNDLGPKSLRNRLAPHLA